MTSPLTPEAGNIVNVAQVVARLRKRGHHLRSTWDDGDMEFTVADMLTSLTAENATLRHDNDIRRQNMSDTWQAMMAMRDSINEHVQLPSLESDLLQGPENSVFCEVVATAVIGELATLRASEAAALDRGKVLTEALQCGRDYVSDASKGYLVAPKPPDLVVMAKSDLAFIDEILKPEK